MVREKYGVRLTAEQRNQLQHLVRAGKGTARVTVRARILLKTDDEQLRRLSALPLGCREASGRGRRNAGRSRSGAEAVEVMAEVAKGNLIMHSIGGRH